MANKIQVKRTTITGRTPNTTNSGNTHFIDTGELALNLTDGKMFSSNGTVYFEVGANLANQTVTGTVNAASFTVGTNFIANTTQVTISAGVLLSANGGVGTAGQVLASNGSSGSPYWVTVAGGGGGSGTVTQVNTGVGLSGGPITTTGTISVIANNGIVANSTGLFANAGTGLVVNTTGIHVNSSYIATLDANNSSYLGGIVAASYVQNTDSRTLSGNLVISGTSFTPSSNTILLGKSTQRWVLSANTGDFTGAITGTTADLSTSVNSAILSVDSNFIANTTQVTLAAGVLLSANGGVGTAGQVLHSNGATGSPYWAVDDSTSVTDDTTTNGNRYILFANQTSSTLTTSYVSSTKMYFNPSTGKLNATAFNSLSDFNKKENIQTLQDATSKVLKMRGVSFTWKGTNDKSIGLIAQEVEKILPEVVSTCEDGVKSISYDSIVGLLIEAFKEQQKTIDGLKDTINILSKNNNIDGDSK